MSNNTYEWFNIILVIFDYLLLDSDYSECSEEPISFTKINFSFHGKHFSGSKNTPKCAYLGLVALC